MTSRRWCDNIAGIVLAILCAVIIACGCPNNQRLNALPHTMRTAFTNNLFTRWRPIRSISYLTRTVLFVYPPLFSSLTHTIFFSSLLSLSLSLSSRHHRHSRFCRPNNRLNAHISPLFGASTTVSALYYITFGC